MCSKPRVNGPNHSQSYEAATEQLGPRAKKRH